MAGRAGDTMLACCQLSETTVSTRRRTGTMHQQPRTDAAPAAQFVAQTESYRAKTIPWTKARATSARAGLLACGSSRDICLPDPRID